MNLVYELMNFVYYILNVNKMERPPHNIEN